MTNDNKIYTAVGVFGLVFFLWKYFKPERKPEVDQESLMYDMIEEMLVELEFGKDQRPDMEQLVKRHGELNRKYDGDPAKASKITDAFRYLRAIINTQPDYWK